jgi:hypothetical protein
MRLRIATVPVVSFWLGLAATVHAAGLGDLFSRRQGRGGLCRAADLAHQHRKTGSRT